MIGLLLVNALRQAFSGIIFQLLLQLLLEFVLFGATTGGEDQIPNLRSVENPFRAFAADLLLRLGHGAGDTPAVVRTTSLDTIIHAQTKIALVDNCARVRADGRQCYNYSE